MQVQIMSFESHFTSSRSATWSNGSSDEPSFMRRGASPAQVSPGKVGAMTDVVNPVWSLLLISDEEQFLSGIALLFPPRSSALPRSSLVEKRFHTFAERPFIFSCCHGPTSGRRRSAF